MSLHAVVAAADCCYLITAVAVAAVDCCYLITAVAVAAVDCYCYLIRFAAVVCCLISAVVV